VRAGLAVRGHPRCPVLVRRLICRGPHSAENSHYFSKANRGGEVMHRAKAEADDVFCDALELAGAAERAAYLDRVCGDDADLRRRVERLLEAHAEADNFLAASPAVTAATTDPVAEAAGTLIGPYKLMELIGEGGMGLVFVAEQTQPVRRRV